MGVLLGFLQQRGYYCGQFSQSSIIGFAAISLQVADSKIEAIADNILKLVLIKLSSGIEILHNSLHSRPITTTILHRFLFRFFFNKHMWINLLALHNSAVDVAVILVYWVWDGDGGFVFVFF